MIAFLLAIIFLFMMFGGIDLIVNSINRRMKKRTKLQPHEYEWGNGKDLTGLIVVDAIQSPEYPELLAETTIARLSKEWDDSHPSETEKERRVWEKSMDRVMEQLNNQQELLDSKSELIADQRKQILSLKNQVTNYQRMGKPTPYKGAILPSKSEGQIKYMGNPISEEYFRELMYKEEREWEY